MRFLSKLFVLLSCVVLCATVVLAQSGAASNFVGAAPLAPLDPNLVFEVGDGNSTRGDVQPDGANPNCDWNTYNPTLDPPGNITNTPAAVCAGNSATEIAYGFLVGAPGEKNFQGGGSKDPNLISQWGWSVSSTPDKDTITDGFAVSFNSLGHKILAFGADRFAVNGDANIGIWFFQQQVGPNASGGFDGAHVDGDVFLVSAFTGGGGHPVLDVYGWDHTCSNSNYKITLPVPAGGECGATNLRLLFDGGAGQLCISSSPACDVVNSSQITVGWPYEAKFGLGTNTIPAAGFFEGGVDLSALFPNPPGCFSSFLVETRSSQSPSAVLKDFLSGSFPECHIAVDVSCNCTSFNPTQVGYTFSVQGTITNDGGGTVYNVSVTDPKTTTYNCPDMPKGTTLKWGANAGAGDCTPAGGSFTDSVDPSSDQVTAKAFSSPSGGTQVDAASQTRQCAANKASGQVCAPGPGISVSTTCVTGLSVLTNSIAVRVDYTGLVTNTGNDNLNTVSVKETSVNAPNFSATYNVGTMTPGQAACYTNLPASGTPPISCPSLGSVGGQTTVAGAGTFFPTTLTTDLTTVQQSGRATFTVHAAASGTDPYGTQKTDSENGAQACLVCPLGFCPAN
jgi:hypothetical protein